MKQKLRLVLGLLILLGTIGAFSHYIATHPEILRKLGDTNPLLVISLLALYTGWFLAYVLVTRISLRICGKRMDRQENFLFNAYSSLINFFGPGQSGPAFRTLYLKKRHQVRIKDFIFVTLLYFAFYAVINAFFLLVGSRPWWQTALIVITAAVGSLFAIRLYAKRSEVKPGGLLLTPQNLGLLFGATALQMIFQLIIFYVELQGAHPGTSLAQALTYTGAANFALFVSLTPGAIGIREAFLVFSQNLHNLSNGVIVAANVVDRAVYLLFLGILFLLTLSLHAKDKLHITQLKAEEAPEKIT